MSFSQACRGHAAAALAMLLFTACAASSDGVAADIGQRLIEVATAADRTVLMVRSVSVSVGGFETESSEQYRLSGADFAGASDVMGFGGEIVVVAGHAYQRQSGAWEAAPDPPPNPDPFAGLTVNGLQYAGQATTDGIDRHQFRVIDAAAALERVLSLDMAGQIELSEASFDIAAADDGKPVSANLAATGRHSMAGEVSIALDYQFSEWGADLVIAAPIIGSTPSPSPSPSPFAVPPGTLPPGAEVGRLAFAGRWDGALYWATVVVDADGANGTLWYDGAGGEDPLSPAWSPDGRQLALSVGSCPFVGDYCVRTLALMKADGGMTPLTESSVPRIQDSNPRWSPDGQRLIFDSNRRAPEDSFSQQLFVVNVDGSELTWIDTGTVDARLPDWSPDGEWILFMGGDDSFESGLYVARADGSETHRLADGGGSGYARWSPDGARIAWSRYNGSGQQVLVVLSADGSELTETIPGTFHDWSVSGDVLVYTLPPGEERQIWMVRPDGGGARRLPFHDYWISGIDWGSDPR